ncbi:hypothetical protein KPATCC21470_1978 [Kitasatospora purpeofusca]
MPGGPRGGAPRDRRGLIDLTKADYCSLGHGKPERDALFEDCEPLPADIAHLTCRCSGTPS